MQPLPDSVRNVARAVTFGAAIACAVAIAVLWFGTARVGNVTPAWPRGHTYSYILETRGEGIDVPGAMFGANRGEQHFTLEVRARLHAAVLDAGDLGATVAISFDSPHVRFSSTDARAVSYEAALERDLSLTYLQRTDASGRVIAFASDPRASSIGDGYVRALVGTLSVSKAPEQRNFSRTWHAIETVADGVRSSDYELALWLDSPLSVPTARFVRTARIATPAGRNPNVVTPIVFAKCFDQGLIRSDGVLSHMLAVEKRGVRIGERRIATSFSTVEATLVSIAETAAPPGDSKWEARSAATADGLYVAPSSQTLRANAYRSAASSTTFAAVAARLRAEAPASSDSELSDAFAAQFFAHPESIAAAAPLFTNARPGTRIFETIKLGLQNAGTAAAQSLLARTMLARAAEPASTSLAEALARMARPDANAIAALRTLAVRNPGCRKTVALALGTAAAALATTDPTRAKDIVDDLRRQLAHTHRAASRRVLLLALGNAGATAAAPDISDAARDADADVRAAAALALRALPAPDADATLLALLRDPQAIVRLDAVEAFSARVLERRDFDALVHIAQSDPDRNVRVTAIDDFASAYDAYPETQDRLNEIVRKDGDNRVHGAAKAELAHIAAMREADRL